jgi:ATP-dependent Lhr-like helicase
LTRLAAEGRLVEGEFRPDGRGREWTEAGVLRTLQRRSLAKLRQEVEPVEQAVLGRFATTWQGVVGPRHITLCGGDPTPTGGADALLDAIEQLQGAALTASILETEILPARVDAYDPADLDAVTAAGEVIWIGMEPLGEHDGRVALYLADKAPRLLAPPDSSTAKLSDLHDRERSVVEYLRTHGASFFGPLHDAVGGGYAAETVNALWDLVWRGLVTNDTFHALRARTRVRPTRRRAPPGQRAAPFRSRRLAPPSAEGRWSLTMRATADDRNVQTRWAAAITEQLLARHGVLTREAVAAETIAGGFAMVYPVLKGLEERGRVRRGYFVAGLGATQFALPGALDLLRSLRDQPDQVEVAVLAATDPANPYGAALKWPRSGPGGDTAGQNAHGRGPTRSVGATVILVNGALGAYLARGDRQLTTFLPDAEPQRSVAARAIATVLIERGRSGTNGQRGMLIEEIDGAAATLHPLRASLIDAGFIAGALGLQATSRSLEPADTGLQPSPGHPAAGPGARRAAIGVSRVRSSLSSPFSRRYFDDQRGEPGKE